MTCYNDTALHEVHGSDAKFRSVIHVPGIEDIFKFLLEVERQKLEIDN